MKQVESELQKVSWKAIVTIFVVMIVAALPWDKPELRSLVADGWSWAQITWRDLWRDDPSAPPTSEILPPGVRESSRTSPSRLSLGGRQIREFTVSLKANEPTQWFFLEEGVKLLRIDVGELFFLTPMNDIEMLIVTDGTLLHKRSIREGFRLRGSRDGQTATIVLARS